MSHMLIGVILGALAGGVIGHFGKCSSGRCPLTSNPYIGAIYGGIIGALLMMPQ